MPPQAQEQREAVEVVRVEGFEIAYVAIDAVVYPLFVMSKLCQSVALGIRRRSRTSSVSSLSGQEPPSQFGCLPGRYWEPWNRECVLFEYEVIKSATDLPSRRGGTNLVSTARKVVAVAMREKI